MKIKKLFFFIFLVIKSHHSSAEYTVDTLRIFSDVLQENRQMLIFRPENMHHTDSVSIIYFPDGDAAKSYYSVISDDSSGKYYVAVGIIQTDRRRDLLPVQGAYSFMDFIEKELLPLAEKDLLIKERILYGHSFGGAFTLYALTRKPDLFNKYIASSPTPIMNIVDPAIFESLDTNLRTPVSFYFSYGSNDMKQVIRWTQKLHASLMDCQLKKIRWKNNTYEGMNHSNVDLISLLDGLKF